MGKGPRVVAQVPDTWLGGCLRQDAGRTDWAGVIRVLSDVSSAFPDLGEFALHAANLVATDLGATAEEVLAALNSARRDRNENLMDIMYLIGISRQAASATNRHKTEAVLSRWEPAVAEALGQNASNPDGGMASVQDRKTFFTMRGMFKEGGGVRVNVDARGNARVEETPAVEAGNVAFQALLDGDGDVSDETDEEN